MKKKMLLALIMMTVSSACLYAEEQEMPEADNSQIQRQQEPMPGDNAPGEMEAAGMSKQGGPMMGKMGMGMHPTLVATSDGGVVLLMGKRLVKYDSQLELVKETEIKGGPRPDDKNSTDQETRMRRRPRPMSQEPMAEASDSPETVEAVQANEMKEN